MVKRKDAGVLITFDLDEVLILNPFGSGVFPYVRKRISEQSGADPADVRRAIVAEARARQLRGDMVASYNWDDIIRQVSAGFGVEWTVSIAQLVEDYCVPPHIKLHPGAVELLTELSEQGHMLRALTNGYRKYQYPVLQALGIVHFFERIVTPDQAGAAKPQQEIFAAAKSGCTLPHVHIGDHVIHDVWGANRSGAVSIWVRHRLPEGWEQKTPLERASDPLLAGLVQEGIDSDLSGGSYPGLRPEEALPRFVVSRLAEVNGVIASLKAIE